MGKQSDRKNTGDRQLGVDLTVAFSASSPDACAPVHANSPVEANVGPSVNGVVVAIRSVLERRAAERDWALLKAVQARATHLEDCLLKRR